MKKALILLSFVFNTIFGIAQPGMMQDGWGVMTFAPSSSTNDYSFAVYNLADNYNVSPGTTVWPRPQIFPTGPNASSWLVDSTGNLFGIAIDSSGNIYLGAGGIYNLPKLKGNAGWGGIYKVNNIDWLLTKFIISDSITTYQNNNIIPNTTWGLGDLTYNGWHDQIFFSNLEDGKIYRSDLNGTILSTYDYGNPDVSDSLYAFPGEMIYGLTVNGSSTNNVRLYFAVIQDTNFNSNYFSASTVSEIWSIALDPATGDFSGSTVYEFSSTHHSQFGSTSAMVTDMCSTNDGAIIVAQRSISTIDWPAAHESFLQKFIKNGNGTWQSPQNIYVGTYSNYDAAGGIDLGYKQNSDSSLQCEEYIWATADALVFDFSDYVYGAAAIPIAGNSNTIGAPDYCVTTSIVIDHNNMLTDVPKTSLGDIEIYRKYCEDSTVIWEPPIVSDTCLDIYSWVVPNVFSPNKDFQNDFFELDAVPSCKDFKITIFDRWGIEVYKSNDPDFKWDGNLNNKECSEGVYFYMIHYGSMEMKGFLHLKR